MKNNLTICPRCNVNSLDIKDKRHHALSGVDNTTYICSKCGVDEAIKDIFMKFRSKKRAR